MEPAITKTGWIRIRIIAVVGLLILPFTPGPRQFWNLHLAQVHADKLRPSLLADPRFKHVRLNTYTGGGGSLMLTGEIANEADKAELKKLVIATHPPVNVFYMTVTSAELHKWDRTDAEPAATPTAKRCLYEDGPFKV